jgi:hypothetical protein
MTAKRLKNKESMKLNGANKELIKIELNLGKNEEIIHISY